MVVEQSRAEQSSTSKEHTALIPPVSWEGGEEEGRPEFLKWSESVALAHSDYCGARAERLCEPGLA